MSAAFECCCFALLILACTIRILRSPLLLHYGDDEAVWGLTEQFLVGAELLVAPCMTQGAVSTSVYFPRNSGPWVHLVSPDAQL